jgi:hypothetical protein
VLETNVIVPDPTLWVAIKVGADPFEAYEER